MNESQKDSKMERTRAEDQKRELVHELKSVFEDADIDCSGAITFSEFKAMVEAQDIRRKFTHLGFQDADIDDLFVVLDSDQEGTLELQEFVNGLVKLMSEIQPKDL